MPHPAFSISADLKEKVVQHFYPMKGYHAFIRLLEDVARMDKAKFVAYISMLSIADEPESAVRSATININDQVGVNFHRLIKSSGMKMGRTASLVIADRFNAVVNNKEFQ